MTPGNPLKLITTESGLALVAVIPLPAAEIPSAGEVVPIVRTAADVRGPVPGNTITPRLRHQP
jgi:hypothetical protein